jgi:hypothetical protein
LTSINRRGFLNTIGLAASSTALPKSWANTSSNVERKGKHSGTYELAAYYFGNYHVDPRNEKAHGPGWTEWQIVKTAKPRFSHHLQPKMPLWGYQDESDPAVFAKKIDAASNAGLTAFIFDWYYYDGPFLEAALEKGYLQAINRDKIKFALMWANHDWVDAHPAKLTAPAHLQYPGTVTVDECSRITDLIIKTYFSVPSYWKIDGCPYFSIYELNNFIKGVGGVTQAAYALNEFRAKTKAAGFPDLHLNVVTAGVRLLPGELSGDLELSSLNALLDKLNVNSTTSYVWVHHAKMDNFPETSYSDVSKSYESYRSAAATELGRPYFPNVSMGWDPSPRACQSDIYIESQYPFTPIISGNTPEAFGEALRSAKLFLDQHQELKNKIITINSWNEWTEGSYLEPDTRNEYAYLNQIADVFGGTKVK